MSNTDDAALRRLTVLAAFAATVLALAPATANAQTELKETVTRNTAGNVIKLASKTVSFKSGSGARQGRYRIVTTLRQPNERHVDKLFPTCVMSHQASMTFPSSPGRAQAMKNALDTGLSKGLPTALAYERPPGSYDIGTLGVTVKGSATSSLSRDAPADHRIGVAGSDIVAVSAPVTQKVSTSCSAVVKSEFGGDGYIPGATAQRHLREAGRQSLAHAVGVFTGIVVTVAIAGAVVYAAPGVVSNPYAAALVGAVAGCLGGMAGRVIKQGVQVGTGATASRKSWATDTWRWCVTGTIITGGTAGVTVGLGPAALDSLITAAASRVATGRRRSLAGTHVKWQPGISSDLKEGQEFAESAIGSLIATTFAGTDTSRQGERTGTPFLEIEQKGYLDGHDVMADILSTSSIGILMKDLRIVLRLPA